MFGYTHVRDFNPPSRCGQEQTVDCESQEHRMTGAVRIPVPGDIAGVIPREEFSR